ncbi:MAG: hypothetical protein RBR75_00795 [Acholeplasmataceae bacterium]|nr:hypothetical protein [Acholeplasmataceae bacterium]
MKHLKLKIFISVIVVLIGLVLVRFLTMDNRAESDGIIYLYIEGENQVVVFEGELEFYQGDTFFDVLDRAFELTCANASYQPDTTCSYTFQVGYQSKVILGIKNDDFELMTDWTHTFLSIYLYNDGIKELSTLGASNIPYQDEDTFLISYEEAWG